MGLSVYSAFGGVYDIGIYQFPSQISVGTTTTMANYMTAAFTASTTNATSTLEIGKPGQNKGTCMVVYNSAGTVEYAWINGTTWTVSATKCF